MTGQAGKTVDFHINLHSCRYCCNLSAVKRLHVPQARRQNLPAGGAKKQEGPKTRRGATFLKYNIGCMQQSVGKT